MGINWSKVLVGGLAAAVAMIVIGVVGNMYVIGSRMQQEMAAAAPTLPRTPSAGAIAGAIVTQIVVGVLLAWLYAAMRPRFGPGAGTAARAALVVWILGFLFYLDWWHVGIMSTATYAMASVTQLVSVLVGAWIAGRLYSESAPPAGV